MLREGLEIVRKYLQQVVEWMRVQWSHNSHHLWLDTTDTNANHGR
jgi:hypothetical protein